MNCKRRISILLATVLFASLIGGCFSTTPPVVEKVNTIAPTPTLVPTATKEPEVFKVTFLLADSPLDHGWNAAHYRGIESLKELGKVTEEDNLFFTVRLKDGRLLEVKVIEKVGYNPADIKRVAQEAVNAGAQMIFGTWWDSKDAMAELAEQYPKVLFEHGSGYPVVQSNGRNFSTYFIRQELGDFVAGYIAGRLGYSEIGAIGTYMIPEPVRAMNGFYLGMRRGLAESNLDPDKAVLRVIWISSWLDQEKEILAAEGLIGEGYDVIRQLADTPYSSMAACQSDKIAFGYGTDVSSYAPCAIVTNEWNWGPYYRAEVLAALNGSWHAQDWWGGFESDAINIVGWNKSVSPEVRSATDELIGQLKSGWNPFCGPLRGRGLDANGKEMAVIVPAGKCLSDADLLSMQWFVDGVESELPSPSPTNHQLELVDAPK